MASEYTPLHEVADQNARQTQVDRTREAAMAAGVRRAAPGPGRSLSDVDGATGIAMMDASGSLAGENSATPR